MTDNEKLKKLKKLADAMYYAAKYLTTDASRLHRAMDEYHKFIIHECKEEPISEVWHDYLSGEDATLMGGERILVVYENSIACPTEIITYNTDVWTDEIVRWARLDDILKL